MKKILAVLLLLTLLTQSSIVQSMQTEVPVLKIDEGTTLSFDASNSSSAVSMLSDNTTQLNVQFYGTGWSQITISNWHNNGTITIEGDAMITFVGAVFTGSLTLKSSSLTIFDGSSIEKCIITSGGGLQLMNSYVDDITNTENGATAATAEISLMNSSVLYMYNLIRPSAAIVLNGSTINPLSGYVNALNLTMDSLSVVDAAYYDVVPLSGYVPEITVVGMPHFYYHFDNIGGLSSAKLLLENATLVDASSFNEFSNATLRNIEISESIHKYSWSSTSLTLKNSNGTINGLTASENVSLTTIGCYMDFSNIIVGDLIYKPISDEFINAMPNKVFFNDTTILHNLKIYTTQYIYLTNVNILDEYQQMILAKGLESYVDTYSHDSVVYPAITMINSTYGQKKDIIHVPVGTSFVYNGTSLAEVSASNTTVSLKGYSPNYIIGSNNTVRISDAIMTELDIDSESRYFFYNTSIDTPSSSDTHVYSRQLSFENCPHVNITLILQSTNFTASKSAIRQLIFSTGSITQIINCTNTQITQLDLYSGINTRELYINFANVTVDLWISGNVESFTSLHIKLNNSKILGSSGFDWSNVYDLEIYNTVVDLYQGGSSRSQYIELTYKADSIRISWGAFDAQFGTFTLGSKIVIYRMELDRKESWTYIAVTTSNYYEDTSVDKGKFYSYFIAVEYVSGDQSIWLRYVQIYSALHLAALTPLILIPQDYNPEITIDSGSPISLDFRLFIPIWGYNGPYNMSVTSGYTLQYEVLLDNNVIQAAQNVSFYNFVAIYASTAGVYTVRVRGTTGQVSFWSDWQDYNISVTIRTTSTSNTTSPEESFISGFTLLAILPAVFVATLFKRKRKK